MTITIPLVTQLSEQENAIWLQALNQALPQYSIRPLAELLPGQQTKAQVAIVANPHPADLALLPNLQWVQSLWAGVERLVSQTQGANFAIVPMRDPQLARTMAEAVLAWTLYLHRDMPTYRTQQGAKIWRPLPLPLPADRTIGILGLGSLGRQAAHSLVHHGFKVCGWSRTQTALDNIDTFTGNAGLNHVLNRSNILVCLLPLTPKTQGLLNAQTLVLLPQGASLINFARGAIVDTIALIANLDSGHLAHAVLDVFEQEPLPPQSLLWNHAQITVLPHISAPTHKPTASLIVAHNIKGFLATGEIPAAVDRKLGY